MFDTLIPKIVAKVPQTFYMFRSECVADCNIIKSVLEPWIVSWFESAYPLDGPKGPELVPDQIVQFGLRTDEESPDLSQIKHLFSGRLDLHVAVESMELVEKFTSERVPYNGQEVVFKEKLYFRLSNHIKRLRAMENMNDRVWNDIHNRMAKIHIEVNHA